jgi:hypothetical protein
VRCQTVSALSPWASQNRTPCCQWSHFSICDSTGNVE